MSSRNDDGNRDFQRAVDRLESAVQGFVSTAGDTVSDRATGFVEDAAERLEREISNRKERHSRRHSSRRSRRARRSRGGSFSSGYRTRRLYRDPARGKLGGVCAGLARYFGVETWVVRCVALTGLIFGGSLVVPAYIIAWILLDKAPGLDDPRPRSSRNGERAFSSPAPEFGPRFSPRRNLRDTQADLDQLELKLRRMETHVTSGQYELQRELNRIDT